MTTFFHHQLHLLRSHAPLHLHFHHPRPAPEKQAFIPSQPFLTALVQIFPALYQHIKGGFSMEDLRKLGVILHGAVSVPISSDASPFILPSYTEAEIGRASCRERVSSPV